MKSTPPSPLYLNPPEFRWLSPIFNLVDKLIDGNIAREWFCVLVFYFFSFFLPPTTSYLHNITAGRSRWWWWPRGKWIFSLFLFTFHSVSIEVPLPSSTQLPGIGKCTTPTRWGEKGGNFEIWISRVLLFDGKDFWNWNVCLLNADQFLRPFRSFRQHCCRMLSLRWWTGKYLPFPSYLASRKRKVILSFFDCNYWLSEVLTVSCTVWCCCRHGELLKWIGNFNCNVSTTYLSIHFLSSLLEVYIMITEKNL